MDGEERLGRYVLDERIGIGGMAEVYRARSVGDGFEKVVCVKRILPHLAQAPDFASMFRDEAAIAARLQHQNIVQILDYGEDHGALFIAMELIEGLSLHKLLQVVESRGEQLPVAAVVKIGVEICKGLHAAHIAELDDRPLGLVHRDVTPHNIMLSTAGEVKVADFGIAHAAGRRTKTEQGIIKGKVQYMSPEQALGHPFDQRLDQFATGIVLWQALTGRRLFRGATDFAVLEAVIRAQVPRASSVRADIPPGLDDVLARALAREPAHRFPDMAALGAALDEVLFRIARTDGPMDLRPIVTRAMDPNPTAEVPAEQPATAPVIAPVIGAVRSDELSALRESLDAASGIPTKPDGRRVSDSGVWKSAEATADLPAHPQTVTRPNPLQANLSTREMSGSVRSPIAPSTSSWSRLESSPTVPLRPAGSRLNARTLAAGGVFALVVGGLVAAIALGRQSHTDPAPVEAHEVVVGANGVGSTCGTHEELNVTSTGGIAWIGVVRPVAGAASDVHVAVSRTDPIGLVLAAEAPVRWQIDAAAGAQVEHVVLVSYTPQTVAGVLSAIVRDLSGANAPAAVRFTAEGIVGAVEHQVGALRPESVVVCTGARDIVIAPPR